MTMIQHLASKTSIPSPKPAATAAPSQGEAPSAPIAVGDSVTITPGNKRPEADLIQAERLLNSAAVAGMVTNSLKGGDRIEIKSGDQVILEVKKDEISALQKFKAFAGDTLKATAVEVSNIVQQDPAFAFKESALAVKDQVMSGVPEGLKTTAEMGFLPMIRVVALALDGKKAYDTFKRGDAAPLDKFVDGGHLVTDVAGLGGAICMALPAVNPTVGTVLSVVGLVGDMAAYGYHVMKYFQDRGMAVNPSPEPPPTPDPTPPPPTPDPSQPPTNPVV